MKKIMIDLDGAHSTAILHEDIVPNTCKAILEILPLEGVAIHSLLRGRELILHLEGNNRIVLEQEGPRIGTQGGMDGFSNLQPYGAKRIAYIHRDVYTFQREVFEIMFMYGYGTPSRLDPGRIPNLAKDTSIWFATFEEPIPNEFIMKANSMQYTGNKSLRIREV